MHIILRKSVDAFYRKLSKLVHACRNYSYIPSNFNKSATHCTEKRSSAVAERPREYFAKSPKITQGRLRWHI